MTLSTNEYMNEKYCELIQILSPWYILFGRERQGRNIEGTIIFIDHVL